MKNSHYVHGYSSRESGRLLDQASTLTGLLHHDTRYGEGTRVLEAGCGVGAQTVTLARGSPGARFTSVDCSAESLEQARVRVSGAGLSNVTFEQADIFRLPFGEESFDHVFVCFVLEHLHDPSGALASLKRVLKPGGTITVIEGDHGSAYFYPRSREAEKTIHCLVSLQEKMGGNALVGREVYPLLAGAGFTGVRVSPRMVYVDASRPDLVEGFTKQTFIAMVEGVRDDAIGDDLITEPEWERGIRDLVRTCDDDGVFCYTFFKGTGKKES
ncbi:MAG TPA: class I SAM-dependent methyltransferase [Methanoregulaceae archaeon]|nr:class I SAM-dependent methyltransferase [Methanoregulaceae archaeon]